MNDDQKGPATSRPKVSIGVPVYNGENYLDEMFRSLAAQTYTDYEVVVCDNASTDRTPEIIERHAANDERIRVHTAAVNMGAGWNFNWALELARGEYFKWQAHDDLLSPTFLEDCVRVLDERPECVPAYTEVDMVDEHLELIERYGIVLDTGNDDPVVRFSEQVNTWNLCYEIFGVIRRDALDKTEGMGNFSHGDGVLLAHLALLGPYAKVDGPVFISRQHEKQSARLFNYEEGGHDYRSYALWFDPSLQGKMTFPNWAIIGSYRKTVQSTQGLSTGQRVRLHWCLARRMRKDVRLLGSDLRYACAYVVSKFVGLFRRTPTRGSE